MPKANDTLSQFIADAEAGEDRDTLEAALKRLEDLLETGFVERDNAPLPYTAGLDMTDAFRAQFVSEEEAAAESLRNTAIDAANDLERARRRIRYRLKTLFGFDGLRIVEEGDSWTQFPFLLRDIGDALNEPDDFAVFSVGAAGDLISNMAAEKEYLEALKTTQAPALVLSGGGNDLFGTLRDYLFDFIDGAQPVDLINEGALDGIFETVIEAYDTILSDVADAFPAVRVFVHGYDLPYPLEDGRWIGPALTARSIPFDIGREVLRVILDRFNDELAALTAKHSHLIYCDLRGKVDRGPNSWFNELHPKNAGYARAAQVFETAIRDAFAAGSAKVAFAGAERTRTSGRKTIVLDPGHGGARTVGSSSPNNATGPNGTLEKTLTLDVAKRTRDVLTDRGFRVVLTRNTDVNLGLSDRAAVARKLNADAFVSIHFNASDRHNAQGTETFVHGRIPAGPHMSNALCLSVQAEMVAALGLRDRNALHPGGIKRANLGVINPSHHAPRTAVVLHEVSFLDRRDEERRLSTVSYRRKIAVALADGIETYLDRAGAVESLRLGEDDLGDAIELAQRDSAIAAEVGQAFVWDDAPLGHDIDAHDSADISNGHLLTANNSAPESDPFLMDLAAGEARYRQNRAANTWLMDEGDEPNEFDPNVARVFEGMTTDAVENKRQLGTLFSGAERSGFSHAEFEAFIRGLGLRHFSPGEFLVLGAQNGSGRCKGKNRFPPSHLWNNIKNTARMLDQIRDRLGVPVYITSAYRAPAYNACIGGAAASQHMRFNALDWQAASGSLSTWNRVAHEVAATSGQFSGFIKDYPASNFMHIDTRDA